MNFVWRNIIILLLLINGNILLCEALRCLLLLRSLVVEYRDVLFGFRILDILSKHKKMFHKKLGKEFFTVVFFIVFIATTQLL